MPRVLAYRGAGATAPAINYSYRYGRNAGYAYPSIDGYGGVPSRGLTGPGGIEYNDEEQGIGALPWPGTTTAPISTLAPPPGPGVVGAPSPAPEPPPEPPRPPNPTGSDVIVNPDGTMTYYWNGQPVRTVGVPTGNVRPATDWTTGQTVYLPEYGEFGYPYREPMEPEQRDLLVAQAEHLRRQGRIAEAQLLLQRAGVTGWYVDPATGETRPTFAREQWDADNAYRYGLARGQFGPNDYTLDYMRMTGFTPTGDPTLDARQFQHQMEINYANSRRNDLLANLQRDRLGLDADIAYAQSRRADLAANLGRQGQAFDQAQAIRQNYRTDQDLGLRRQGQMFDQWMRRRQQAIDLARNPQDYLTYSFLSAGVKGPQGVGLTDVLNRMGQDVPDVDTYLGRHGMGSVRPQGADNPSVPDVESFLASQAAAPAVNVTQPQPQPQSQRPY